MIYILRLTIVVLILSSFETHSQTYSFRYQYGANEKFINFDEVELETERGGIAHKMMSFYRKVFYSNVYITGYQNDSLFYYSLDFSEFSKAFTDSFSFQVYGIQTEKKEYSLDFTGFADSNRISKLSNKNFAVNIKNETVRGKYKILEEELLETLEQKVINGWTCIKWIPKNPSIQNKVEVWVCKDIPRQINLGLFNNDLNGGVVEIAWEQGVFHRLVSYQDDTELIFPIDYLYGNHLDLNDVGTNLLRSGLRIGKRDKIDENIEFHTDDNIFEKK